MRHILLLATAAALSIGCGRPLLSAEVEIERISVTTEPIAFPDVYALGSTAAGLDPIEGSTTIALEYELGEVPDEQEGVNLSLWLTGFALHLAPEPGATRLPDLLREVDVILIDPETAATTLVAQYSSGGGKSPMDVVFQVPGLDLMPFLDGKKLAAEVKLHFDTTSLPNAFTARAELSFNVRVTANYLDLM